VEAICLAADDMIAGKLSGHFPLTTWQSGSGRETDTNVNEVLANRAIQLLGGAIGSRDPIDPTRDVNLGQSLTCMFTTALHIAIVIELEETLVPSVTTLARALDRAALPSLARQLRVALARIDEAEGGLHEIAGGGGDGETSGSGAAPNPVSEPVSESDWRVMAAMVASETRRPFIPAPDGYADHASLDAVVAAMAAVRGLVITLLNIVDVLHARTPTSTQDRKASLEAMSMVCISILGMDQIVAAAASRGNREPHAIRPVIVTSVLNAIRTLGLACASLRRVVAATGRR
jgi:fumarate hydratase class II